MFLGIDRPEWFLLWSGVLGAVLSAGAAAWVAVRVLTRSNRHQRELAEEAAVQQALIAREQMEGQQRNADQALREQREQLRRQISEQRSIADRQISEQGRLASLAREQQAIAEVIIATEDFIAVQLDSDKVAAEQMRGLRVAVARWRAELGADEMQNELLLWTRLFDRISNLLRAQVRAGEKESGLIVAGALSDAMAALSGTALSWQRADRLVRESLYRHLLNRRTEIETELRSIDGGGT